MFRHDNWILWFIVGLVIVGFLGFLSSCEVDEVEQEEPRPTAVQRVYPTRVPTYAASSYTTVTDPTPWVSPTPAPTRVVSTPTPRPIGLGVSLADIKDTFGGMTFEHHPLADGRDRWMASNETDGIIVEAIGPRGSLQQATLAMPVDNALTLTVLVTAFLETVLPRWESGVEWVSDNLVKAVGKEVTTRVGRATIKMEVYEWGSLTLVVKSG